MDGSVEDKWTRATSTDASQRWSWSRSAASYRVGRSFLLTSWLLVAEDKFSPITSLSRPCRGEEKWGEGRWEELEWRGGACSVRLIRLMAKLTFRESRSKRRVSVCHTKPLQLNPGRCHYSWLHYLVTSRRMLADTGTYFWIGYINLTKDIISFTADGKLPCTSLQMNILHRIATDTQRKAVKQRRPQQDLTLAACENLWCVSNMWREEYTVNAFRDWTLLICLQHPTQYGNLSQESLWMVWFCGCSWSLSTVCVVQPESMQHCTRSRVNDERWWKGTKNMKLLL